MKKDVAKEDEPGRKVKTEKQNSIDFHELKSDDAVSHEKTFNRYYPNIHL